MTGFSFVSTNKSHPSRHSSSAQMCQMTMPPPAEEEDPRDARRPQSRGRGEGEEEVRTPDRGADALGDAGLQRGQGGGGEEGGGRRRRTGHGRGGRRRRGGDPAQENAPAFFFFFSLASSAEGEEAGRVSTVPSHISSSRRRRGNGEEEPAKDAAEAAEIPAANGGLGAGPRFQSILCVIYLSESDFCYDTGGYDPNNQQVVVQYIDYPSSSLSSATAAPSPPSPPASSQGRKSGGGGRRELAGAGRSVARYNYSYFDFPSDYAKNHSIF